MSKSGELEVNNSGMKVPADFKLYRSADEIANCVKRLGAEISPWMNEFSADDSILVMPILRGAFFLVADLMRVVLYPVKLTPVRVKAYNEETNRPIKESLDMIAGEVELANRRILLVDDICDSGRTLNFVSKVLKSAGAKEVRSCVLIKRECQTETPFNPDYVGMHYTGPEWFVGYGMDNHDYWRNLPDLYIVNPEK